MVNALPETHSKHDLAIAQQNRTPSTQLQRAEDAQNNYTLFLSHKVKCQSACKHIDVCQQILQYRFQCKPSSSLTTVSLLKYRTANTFRHISYEITTHKRKAFAFTKVNP